MAIMNRRNDAKKQNLNLSFNIVYLAFPCTKFDLAAEIKPLERSPRTPGLMQILLTLNVATTTKTTKSKSIDIFLMYIQ